MSNDHETDAERIRKYRLSQMPPQFQSLAEVADYLDDWAKKFHPAGVGGEIVFGRTVMEYAADGVRKFLKANHEV